MDTTKPQKAAPTRRKWTIIELAAEMSARYRTGEDDKEVCPDTLVKARRKGTTKSVTAKQLEEITGIDRRRFQWPDEFGDPWPEIIANGNGGAQ